MKVTKHLCDLCGGRIQKGDGHAEETEPMTDAILDLNAIQLKAGGNAERRADALCVMEAVAWVAGEPHSDHPVCACPVIAVFLRNWNDSILDDDTRTRLLAPLIPRLVGSKSTDAVELRRSYLALDWLAREQAPAWLSLRDDLKAHAVALRSLAPLTDADACRQAQPAVNAAMAAARDAAMAAAGGAARAAAMAAARDAAMAAAGGAARDAARDAAWAAARAAAGAAARDAAGAAARAAAMAAAGDAAGDAAMAALAPTVTALQVSALALVDRMLAVRDKEAK